MPTDPNAIIGQREGLSPTDIRSINTTYTQVQFLLQTGTALHETGNDFAFAALPNGDLMAIKKSGTGTGTTEVHILEASSNYQSFRLHTATALHETGNNVVFGALRNGSLMAVIKWATGTNKTEVHIMKPL